MPAAAGALGRAQYPVLSLGNRGSDVVALQHLLRHHGLAVDAGGFFDGRTRSALAGFQGAHGLSDDGVARATSWRALAPALQPGSSGEAVLAFKSLLNAKRSAGLSFTPDYDEPTAAAARAMQTRFGLPQTGAADEGAWRHLLWAFEQPNLDGPMCAYELHAGPSRKWATAAAVGQLSAAATLFEQRTGQRLAVGDMSYEPGGPISGHRTHRVGLDVDVRAARRDGRSCMAGIAHWMRSYDRDGTRQLIRAIHDAAPGRVKLIYFNDPVLVREGLTKRYPHHDAHLHIRYCEADHPSAAYRCPAGAAQDADDVSDPLAGPPLRAPTARQSRLLAPDATADGRSLPRWLPSPR